MKKVHTILQQLAATSSTNAKKALLEKNADNQLLQDVLVYAYSPKYKYYIKKIPQYEPTGTSNHTIMFEALDAFRKRELTGNAAIDRLTATLTRLSEADAKLLENIIKGDLRCGINATSINKVWKKLIPDPTYMRCSLPKQAKLKTWPFATPGCFNKLK